MNASTTPWEVDEQDFPSEGTPEEKLSFLLRYAILASSSHNTQPWLFAIGDGEIRVFADKARWLQVADPDQRELHVSLGCALENLLVAAEHFGYGHEVTYLPEPENEDLVAAVTVTPGSTPSAFRPAALFDAIPRRRTNHNTFAQRAVPQDVQTRIQTCHTESNLSLHMTNDPAIKRRVDEMIVEADARQFADPAWREELGHWMGKGVFGTPWLMSKISQLAVTYLDLGQSTAKKDSELLMSAPILSVINSTEDDHKSQIQSGQLYERVALMATALNLAVHPMSQILEMADLKSEVADLIPVPGVVPQHTFRLGYAEPKEGHTPRRSLNDVLIEHHVKE
jgi:nitroreductase